ncbi:hypothetical protein ACGFLS_30825 [Streptomyces abikoensis]|uniref:hypothetical protein n=1 Tax=Streptomyces abikoensis TaxID=97398 RepID=UPI00371A2135
MSDHDAQAAALVHDVLDGHADDGPISAFVSTGAVTEELFPALDAVANRLEDQGDYAGAKKVAAVIMYAMESRGRSWDAGGGPSLCSDHG